MSFRGELVMFSASWLGRLWVAVTLSLVPCGRAQVVINELHYNPDVKTDRVEFIELHNAGEQPADLTGWRFSAGVSFTFPAVEIPPGGFVVLAENPAALKARFGAVSYTHLTLPTIYSV
mgnify:CR=1 FL=1